MKKLYFLSLLLCFLATPCFGLDIIWWNTAGAWHTGKSFSLSKIKMNQGIRELYKLNPDILILGEYHAPAIEASTNLALQKNYPFIQSIFCSTLDHRIEWIVFSKIPFKVTLLEDELTWASSSNQSDWISRVPNIDFDFNRSLGIFQFEDFNILPVHLAQPWKYLDFLQAIQEIINGEDHPVAVQLKKINNIQLNKKSLLVGDFNLPPSLLFNEPQAWKHLSKWNRLHFNQGDYSFPTLESRQLFPPMLLDQAFSSVAKDQGSFEVLKIKGSDHYPIRINWR